jgi:hypothetical protein
VCIQRAPGGGAKECAIRRHKKVQLLKILRKPRRSAPADVQLLLRVGATREEAGRSFGCVPERLPQEGEEVTRQTFTFQLDPPKLQKAARRGGHYLRRSNLVGENSEVLWERYVLLTQVEAALRTWKSEWGLRPIYHQMEKRVEAHIIVACLAYALSVRRKERLAVLAQGLRLRAVLNKLAAIQMLDVSLGCAPLPSG